MVRIAKGMTEAWGALATPLAQWIVLRTKSRQEKAVARHLAARRVRHYLPMIHRVIFSSGRRLRSEVPVFPGYVFIHGEFEDAYDAVATRRVCQIIRVRDQRQLVRELAQVRRALAAGSGVRLSPEPVSGKKYRVAKGPFLGLEGVVQRCQNRFRLVMQVDILGRGVALELDDDMLVPID